MVTIEYDQLLAYFPLALREQIRAHFPQLPQLQGLQDLFRDRGIPMDVESCVAYVVNAEIRAREETRAAQRSVLFCAGMENKYDENGLTVLHGAVLAFDFPRVRELLAQGASPKLTVCPGQRRLQFENLCGPLPDPDSDDSIDFSDKEDSEGETLNILEWAQAEVLREHRRLARLESKVSKGKAGPEELERARWHDPERHLHEMCVEAAKQGNARVGKLSVTVAAHAGENALTFAISCGAPTPLVALLVEHCIQNCPELLNEPDDNGNLPLVMAAANARPDVVRLLLQPGTGVEVDQQNMLGRSALMEAARNGDIKLLEFLLRDCKASCDLTDNHHNTASALAALRQHLEAFDLLHAWETRQSVGEAREKMMNRVGQEFVAACQRRNLQLLADLMKRHPDQISDGVLQSALTAALGVPGNGAVIDWFMRHVWDRLNKGQHQIPFPEGLVVDCKGLEIVLDAICTADAHLSSLPKQRVSNILALAIRHGSLKYVRHALDAGADIDAPIGDAIRGNANATAPIVAALRRKDKPILIELLERGARTCGDLGNADSSALACIEAFRPKWQARELLRLIVAHHPDLYGEPGQAAMLQKLALDLNMPDVMNKLVQHGMLDPDIHLNDAESLLMQVVTDRSVELLKVVLQPPAPVRRILAAANGNVDDALARSASFHSSECFDLLLQACGVSRHDEPELLLQRLGIAFGAGFFPACMLILKQGQLDLSASMPAALAWLNKAIVAGRHDVVALLLQHGVQGCDPMTYGESALEYAIRDDDFVLAKIILDAGPKANTNLVAVMPLMLFYAWITRRKERFEFLVDVMQHIDIEPGALDHLHQWAKQIGSVAASTQLAARCRQLESPAWRREQERPVLAQQVASLASATPALATQMALLETAIDLGDVDACGTLLKTLPTGSAAALLKRAVTAPWPELAIVKLLLKHAGTASLTKSTLAATICAELRASAPNWQTTAYWLGELLASDGENDGVAAPDDQGNKNAYASFAALIGEWSDKQLVPKDADWDFRRVLECAIAMAWDRAHGRHDSGATFTRLNLAASLFNLEVSKLHRFEPTLLCDASKRSIYLGIRKE